LESRNKYNAVIYSYVLMDNHYHFLLETKKANLSKFMKYLNTSYTIYFNKRHKRAGHLLQGRYKRILVDKDAYLLELTRYIHLNPVRAKIVENPEDYKFSSYKYYTNKENQNFIDTFWLQNYFPQDIAKKRYRGYVEEGIKKEITNPLDKLYRGIILGKEKFIEEIKNKIKKRKAKYSDIAYMKHIKEVYQFKDIIETIKLRYKITEEALRKKDIHLKTPQKIAIYLIKKRTGLTLREIGNYFGKRHYTTITQITKRFEKEIIKKKHLQEEIKEVEKLLPYVKMRP